MMQMISKHGLNTGKYFIYKLDSNRIKLSETLYDSKIIPPNVVNIVSIGGFNINYL